MVYSRNEKKILDCLALFPEGTTPKTISRETGVNVNTVKAILPKLKNIKKIVRGFYKVVEEGDGTLPHQQDLMDWNFHNLVLQVEVNHKPMDEVYEFGLLKCRVVVSKAGLASLFVSSDFPLNVSSICMVYGFFLILLNNGFSMDDVKVKTIEFNRDYSNLRLDGLRAITLNSLVEQFKIYQKKRGLRIEHKAKVPFTVENIVDMLRNNPNSLEYNVKLQQQQELLNGLAEALSNNTNILFDIIDKLNKGDGIGMD